MFSILSLCCIHKRYTQLFVWQRKITRYNESPIMDIEQLEERSELKS